MYNPELNHESREVLSLLNYSELSKLSVGELKCLQEKIKHALVDKQVDELGNIKVGDKVRVNHKKAEGEYTVVKMNKKTYTLENMFGRVKCSIGLISPVAA